MHDYARADDRSSRELALSKLTLFRAGLHSDLDGQASGQLFGYWVPFQVRSRHSSSASLLLDC